MVFSSDELAQFRTDTPSCKTLVHLNNAGAALQPLVVQQTVQEHLELEYRLGGYEAAALREEHSQRFYQSVARLLNTQAAHIAFTSSATDAYNRALSCIPFQAGDLILTTANDYASNQIAFLQIAQRYGVKIQIAPECKEGGVDVQQMQQLIHRLHPKLVAVTHMPTNSGLIQDVESIGQSCRAEDTLYLVDACQTAGQLPLDVQQIACDFLAATSRKFLRGPRGGGFLYVSERVLKTDWAPHYLDLHSASWTAAEAFVLQEDARRFETWERNHAIVQGTAAAVDYALQLGLDRIHAYTQALAAHAREELQQNTAIQLMDWGAQLGAIVTFHIPGQDPKKLLDQLREENIHSSISWGNYAHYDMGRKNVPWVLRWSPHYYNTIEEVEKATKKIFKIIC